MSNRRIISALLMAVALPMLPGCEQTEDLLGLSGGGTAPLTTAFKDEPLAPTNDVGAYEPIQIHAAPVSLNGYVGQSATFKVEASSNSGLSYQWRHDGSIIQGATSASLSFTIQSVADAGEYSVTVVNRTSEETVGAQLKVGGLPTIVSQPQSVDVYPNQSASLIVNASGPSLRYQWQRKDAGGWVDVVAADSNQLLISSVTPSSAKPYRVVVANPGGQIVSTAAQVVLKTPINIESNPVSQTVNSGTDVLFSVKASGSGALKYRWFKGSTQLSNSTKFKGATSPSLKVMAATTKDASAYRAEIYNSDHSVFSSLAELSVVGPAKVSLQPESKEFTEGQNGSLYVAATGTRPITYIWQKWWKAESRWVNINSASAKSSTLQLPSVSSGNSGMYRVRVSNSAGVDYSQEARILVTEGISIKSQPSDKTVNVGDAVSFSVAASSADAKYEWTKDGQVLSNTGASLSFASVKEWDEAAYGCRVYNDNSSASCSGFSLKVTSPVVITKQPSSQETYEGGSATLSVEATGDPNPSVQWFFGGKQVGSGNSFTLNYVSTDKAGSYYCVVSNASGSETCKTVTVSINEGATILSQPKDTYLDEGGTATLSLSAEGDGLSYQWTKNGVVIGSSSSLVLSAIDGSDSGVYSCRVWNANSSDSCDSFEVAINEKVAVVVQPVAAEGYEGGKAVLSVSTKGKPAPTVDWYHQGKLIRKNTRTLTLSNLTMAQAGDYHCVVSNSVNSVKCDSAAVKVLEKVRIVKQPTNQVLEEGQDIQLSLAASGAAPLFYECYRGSEMVVAATDPADLVIADSDAADQGQYHCVVSNGGSEAVTASAEISVLVDNERSIELSWNHPTQRKDGGTLAVNEIASYSIYIMETKFSRPELKATVAAKETGAVIDGLYPGVHYLAITTTDVFGLESDLSEIVTVNLD